MNNNSQITLAIESAIAGGSLSLLVGDSEVDYWIGSASVSKAEDLLANIDSMLKEKGVGCRDIGLVAVSAGPGSFTGIRIGIATALGLKTGLGIQMASQSALSAMASEAKAQHIIAALPVGRSAVCIQRFEKRENILEATEPQALSEAEFGELLDEHEGKDTSRDEIILHASLYEKYGSPSKTANFGYDLAKAVGILCRSDPQTVVEPLFVSKTF